MLAAQTTINELNRIKAMFKKISTSLLFLFIIVIADIAIGQDYQSWKWMHPQPNGSNMRRVKMISETEWVAVGQNGTFMHTSNSGSSWYFHHFAGKIASTLATTYCYDLWFFNQNTGIVVGDQGYIGRTVNGGVTFDSLGIGLVASNSRCWRIWFADANTGYIGAGSQSAFTSRILKTTDGGITWSTVYSSSSQYVISIGGYNANNVVAAQANGTLVRTTDGGSTWTETVSGIPSNMNDIWFIDSNTGMAAGSQGVAARTTNGGLNWVPANTPQTDWSYFQIKMVSATEAYAIGDPSNLWKTTDLGVTWTSIPISVSGPAVTFVWYSLDFYGSTYVLSGDYGIVAKSTDGGATWSSNNSMKSNQAFFDATTINGTGKYWVVGRAMNSTMREVFYSSNGGDSWTTYDVGVAGDIQSISMVNETTGYISGANSQVFKTTDGGASWIMKPKPHATNYQLYNCEFVDENTGFVFVNFSTVPGGNVFKTTNGGDNWTQYSTGAASENIYSAEMLNANTGFCTMNQSNKPVYKTTNGGVNWTGYSTGLTGNIKSVSVVDSNIVYVCQGSGTSRVAKSTNGGVNWTLITVPVAADFTSIDFKDANTGYICGNSTTTIAKTTNGGTSWSWENAHTTTLVKVLAGPGDTAIAVGGVGAIMRRAGGSSDIKINLTSIIEGMYDQPNNRTVRDEVMKVYLRNATSPYALKDSASSTMDSLTFSGLFTFSNAPSGSYYIVADHFNSIETWSKSGGQSLLANGSTYNYDFTNSSAQAYGNNMIQKGTKWCIYGGDVNKDGIVDLSDITLIFNDATAFVTGYVVTDVNGDYSVDLSDLTLTFNNSGNFVSKITP